MRPIEITKGRMKISNEAKGWHKGIQKESGQIESKQ